MKQSNLAVNMVKDEWQEDDPGIVIRRHADVMHVVQPGRFRQDNCVSDRNDRVMRPGVQPCRRRIDPMSNARRLNNLRERPQPLICQTCFLKFLSNFGCVPAARLDQVIQIAASQ